MQRLTSIVILSMASLLPMVSHAQSVKESSQKSFKEYDEEISRWMIAEATATTSANHELAVIELTRNYSELVRDSRIRLSPKIGRAHV